MRRMGSITGHLRDLGGGSWELVANLPRKPGQLRGTRTTHRIHGVDGVRRASKALARWVAVLEQHECGDPERITLGEVLRRYLIANPGAAKPKVMARYRELADKHVVPVLGEWRVAALKPSDLMEFYAAKQESGRLDGTGGLSVQTTRHMHALIRAALAWAEDEEPPLVATNPARRVKHPPRVKRVKRPVWTDAQILRAVDESGRTQLRVPLALAAWAGLRRSEVCALAWPAVDLEEGTLAVCASVEQVGGTLIFGEPKTDSSWRPLPLPAQLVEILKVHKARQDEMRLAQGPHWNERDLVCCRADGEPMKPDTLSAKWAQFVRQHSLEPRLDFHGLRRSYLSGLHDDGAPDGLIMERAGHTDLRTTHGSYIFTFSETDAEYLRRQEQRIEAARASSAKVCQRSASAVVSMEEWRRARES